jgi:hypothetical protein
MTDDHAALMQQAIAAEAEAQRAALAGDWEAARPRFLEAARAYRASWAAAPPTAYGRLVGTLKASVEGGAGEDEARDALAEVADADPASNAAAYVRAIASVLVGDDASAAEAIEVMRTGSGAFGRAADGLAAIVAGDEVALVRAVKAVAEDFASREQHLTGVPFADTALMLKLLGRRRGLTVAVHGPLLPALPALPER